MAMKPIYNINILVRNKNANELISLSRLLELYSIHIGRKNEITALATNNIRDDFVIISIMMGNDYLPKLGYINHEHLWESYYELVKMIENNETLIINNTINNKIFSKFMYIIYKNLSNNFKKVTIHTYNLNRTKSYFDGLVWCLNMYKNGICTKYDYIYIGKKSPHPYELLFYISSNENLIEIPKSNIEPIPVDIYPLILLPKKGSYLISEKYRFLLDGELKYLYEVEECKICDGFKKNLNKLNKKIHSENLKEEYNNELHKYNEHKKKHIVSFNINDIYNIIKIANKINI